MNKEFIYWGFLDILDLRKIGIRYEINTMLFMYLIIRVYVYDDRLYRNVKDYAYSLARLIIVCAQVMKASVRHYKTLSTALLC